MVNYDKINKRMGPMALIGTFLILLAFSSPAGAQECGDLDASGVVDITDFSVFIDHLFLTQTPLTDSAAADMDGVPGVTINDMVTFHKNMIDELAGRPTPPLNCHITPDTSFQISADTIMLRGTTNRSGGLMMSGPVAVEIRVDAVDEYYSLSLPLKWETNAPYCVLDSVEGISATIDNANQRVKVTVWPPETRPVGDHRVALLHFTISGTPDLAPGWDIVFDTTEYWPRFPKVLSREGVADRGIDGFVPAMVVDPRPVSCCRVSTGNVDCDPEHVVDIS
ncbi:MAG: hypothetical protein GY832_33885, partial [Chloroflexi bacterium]|nr:hypothetical protein [Chloroflexota bacterium]